MIGAGALAAVTVIGAGLVRFPVAAEAPADGLGDDPGRPTRTKDVKQTVRYIRLAPGQKAPPGATVIREAAPTPRVVVRRIEVAGPSRVRQPVARTRQSGR